MAEVQKLFYIVVVDDDSPDKGDGEKSICLGAENSHYLVPQKPDHWFRYTRPVLQSMLQLMGCKPRHAFKISKKVFETMKSEIPSKGREIVQNASSSMNLHQHFSEVEEGNLKVYSEVEEGNLKVFSEVEEGNLKVGYAEQGQEKRPDGIEKDALTENDKKPSLYKKRISVIVKRNKFLDVVCDSLAEYRYVGPNQRADLMIACRIRERKESITILLCGTSGCGKSTLSSLLASRLGITTVVSTDSIRHMMRSFVDEKENSLLWASTYHAGECLDPFAVAEAKAKKKEKNFVGQSVSGQSNRREPGISSKTDNEADASVGDETMSKKQITANNIGSGQRLEVNSAVDVLGSKAMAVEGYKAQSEMVIDSLDRLITAWEERKQSVVVEGVHLSLNFVMGLMKKHPSIIPFMVYIASEEKHLERFAVRAKYMTLDPAKNKYVKYIRNIRAIQDYLCKRADKHLVPKVNNTNVDRSVASIHATIFSCLRRRDRDESLYDQATNTVKVLDEEFRNQCAANSLSSKGMFKLIQRQGSFRRLMALVNTDGSVAKAWPVDTVDSDGRPISNHGADSCIGSPLYGPLDIGKEEPVNLQFGNFGISSWPNDTGGTSYASSIDGNELTSIYSSHSNSPRHSEGPAKELTEELPVPGSDEELDEARQVDSEDELSDTSIQQEEDELQGSVDEESARSDEGYEELGTDEQDGGYWSDNPEGERARENFEKHGLEEKSSKVVPIQTWKQKNYNRDDHSFDVIGKSLKLEPQKIAKPSFNDSSLGFEYLSSSGSLTPCRKSASLSPQHQSLHRRFQSLPTFEPISNHLTE